MWLIFDLFKVFLLIVFCIFFLKFELGRFSDLFEYGVFNKMFVFWIRLLIINGVFFFGDFFLNFIGLIVSDRGFLKVVELVFIFFKIINGLWCMLLVWIIDYKWY